MGLFNLDNQKKEEIQGITRVLQFDIDAISIIYHYYLKTLFSEEDSCFIGERYGGKIIKIEDNEPIIEIPRYLRFTIESHSSGFQKIISRHILLNKETRRESIKEIQEYVFIRGKSINRWQKLWKFKLKDFLSVDEYRRIVGKGYQKTGSEEQREPGLIANLVAHGEELTLELDVGRDILCLFGNYGRFRAFDRRFGSDYQIPEENIILQIHPGVKEYELEDRKYDDPDWWPLSCYLGNENYREWERKGQIRWSIALFDAHGIQDRKNLIKEP